MDDNMHDHTHDDHLPGLGSEHEASLDEVEEDELDEADADAEEETQEEEPYI